MNDTQQFIQSKGYQDALREGLEAVAKAQQENKMSVKELVFWTGKVKSKIKKISDEVFSLAVVEDDIECLIFLDRSQAQMLMLYLQEHLGYVSISKERLNDQ